MGIYSLLMPKMGESVIEATILSWKKNVGDKINENDIILEVATDKVESCYSKKMMLRPLVQYWHILK